MVVRDLKFHGDEDSSRGLLCCDAVKCCDRIPAFRRAILPQSSGRHNPEDHDCKRWFIFFCLVQLSLSPPSPFQSSVIHTVSSYPRKRSVGLYQEIIRSFNLFVGTLFLVLCYIHAIWIQSTKWSTKVDRYEIFTLVVMKQVIIIISVVINKKVCQKKYNFCTVIT
jgi:hypothetical protein